MTEPEPDEPHPRIREKELRDALAQGNENLDRPPEDDDEVSPKKGARGKKGGKDDAQAQKMFSAKERGDFMKPFPSFYDAAALEPPLTGK